MQNHPEIIEYNLSLAVNSKSEFFIKEELVDLENLILSPTEQEYIIDVMLDEDLIEHDSDNKYYLTPFAFEVIEDQEYQLTGSHKEEVVRKDIEESLIAYLTHIKEEWTPFKRFGMITIVCFVLATIFYLVRKPKYDEERVQKEMERRIITETLPITNDSLPHVTE